MNKPRRGRPPIGDATLMKPISVRFPAPMMDAIEKIAAARMDQPDKAAVVRELVAEALAVREKREAKRK
jgi:hypothetical protein